MVDLSEWTGPGVHQALMASADRTLLRGLDGTARSGEEIVHRVGQLAGSLLARGLAGKRIGLWYSNSVAAVEAFLAVEWIGGTRVPLDPDATADEARTTFDAAGVASIIADRTTPLFWATGTVAWNSTPIASLHRLRFGPPTTRSPVARTHFF